MRLLSIYKGLFQGGSPVVHTQVVTHLQTATEDIENVVVSLSDRTINGHVEQSAEESYCYRELEKAGVELHLLQRLVDEPVTDAHREKLQELVDSADALFLLKEQVLPALRGVDLKGKPVIIALHRSDPENQGEGVGDLVELDNSGGIELIISCADAATKAYRAVGMTDTPAVFVHNGVDLERFQPDREAGEKLREELQIPSEAQVVAIAARFDPMKNLPGFIEAAGGLLKERPLAHFILCGSGLDSKNQAVRELIERFAPGASERFHLLGITDRMSEVYNAASILSLPSIFGEAAPLCLLEAMAVGTVPVTTAVGDSAALVRSSELVTDASPAAILEGWLSALSDLRRHRETIESFREELSLQRMCEAYELQIREAVSPTQPRLW